jgi:predicted nucleic acid-binding protein
VSAVILLDAGPLGLLANPKKGTQPRACRQWASSLQAVRRRVIVPEIADYEVRRELIRLNRGSSLAMLDFTGQQFEYLPITTEAMRRAAELWAGARRQGLPAAGDASIDADVILAAQALTLGVTHLLVATMNPAHIARFVPAELWENIAP